MFSGWAAPISSSLVGSLKPEIEAHGWEMKAQVLSVKLTSGDLTIACPTSNLLETETWTKVFSEHYL